MPLTPSVGTGQIITPTWGNTIRDRTVNTFANKAELDTWAAPPDGSFAWTEAETRLWTRIGGVWCRNPDYGSASAITSDASGNVTVPHLLGKTPSAVVATSGIPGGAGAYTVTGTEAYTSTNFRCRTSLVSASVSGIRWVAYP